MCSHFATEMPLTFSTLSSGGMGPFREQSFQAGGPSKAGPEPLLLTVELLKNLLNLVRRDFLLTYARSRCRMEGDFDDAITEYMFAKESRDYCGKIYNDSSHFLALLILAGCHRKKEVYSE
eukprot:1542614-Rhodomonas_salina.2